MIVTDDNPFQPRWYDFAFAVLLGAACGIVLSAVLG